VIADVVIHVANEQPLLADLFALPTAADAGLVCTNVRMLDGKRPVFIDHTESTFFFPYHMIRFLELPAGTAPQPEAAGRRNGSGRAKAAAGDEGSPAPETLLPVAVAAGQDGSPDAEDDLDIELEIDEEFLQRIRDI
jgi:hypothetical protein